MFAAPNTSAVMNSLPPNQRGAGGGMLNTFQNSASVLSIGFFFTIITLGLAATLPHALYSGLTAQGIPAASARSISHLSPIGSLFAAFLGINPIHQLLGSHLLSQPGVHAGYLTGRRFFPDLISGPFGHGLRLAFVLAAAMCFLGAVFSWMRGSGQSTVMHSLSAEAEEGLADVGDVAMAEVGAGSPGLYLEGSRPRVPPSLSGPDRSRARATRARSDPHAIPAPNPAITTTASGPRRSDARAAVRARGMEAADVLPVSRDDGHAPVLGDPEPADHRLDDPLIGLVGNEQVHLVDGDAGLIDQPLHRFGAEAHGILEDLRTPHDHEAAMIGVERLTQRSVGAEIGPDIVPFGVRPLHDHGSGPVGHEDRRAPVVRGR